MSNIKFFIATVAIIIAIVAGAKFINTKQVSTFGSVSQGHEYQGTTTSTGRFGTSVVLCSTPGALGSVIVTGAAAGVMSFYDATTTDATLRSSTQSTSSIVAVSLPASAAANTYTFDRILTRGLIVDTSGTMPTTTITYRCQ